MYKIGLITTINTNIGDDLIRKGIVRLINDIISDVKFISINKHQPETLNSQFDDCNLIIQCGAPTLWNGCHSCGWAIPIWHNVIGRLYKHIPVLNIGGGSCYSSSSPKINEKDLDYIKKIHSYCHTTTVRDRLAHDILNNMSIKSILLPCPALIATNNISNQSDGAIVVNYMHKGGHYDFDNCIDKDKWFNTLNSTLMNLSNHNIVMLCHNKDELNIAKKLFPKYDHILADSPEHLIDIALNAKLGILNRLHASMAFASVGVPSIAIGNDTRLMMTSLVGIPSYHVSSVNCDTILNNVDTLLKNNTEFKNNMINLKEKTYEQYHNLIKNVLQ